MTGIGRPRAWTDEQFELAVAVAKSWSDIARGVGVKPTGKALRTFRELAVQLELDTAHLAPPRVNDGKFCKFCNRPLVGRVRKIFCNSRCDLDYRSAVRLATWLEIGDAGAVSPGRLIRSYLLEDQGHRCALCNTSDTWMEQPLVFVLDHIDGHSEHNQRANLRLICPNCDSQLPTYKGRNNGNGRFTRRQRYAAGQSY